MNPRIPADYTEVGRWLRNFATSHAKREDARIEAVVEMGAARECRSYGLRLVLDPRAWPPGEEPPIELAYTEVGEGKTRFAWCEALSRRIQAEASRLASQLRGRPSQSA